MNISIKTIRVKRKDAKTGRISTFDVHLDPDILVPDFKKFTKEHYKLIIPKSFEQKELLARKIAIAALSTFLIFDDRSTISEELILLTFLKEEANIRRAKIKKIKAENVYRFKIPVYLDSAINNIEKNYERLLKQETNLIKNIDSKLKQSAKMREDDKFFRVKQPHRFVLYLDFLHKKYFPRNENRKEYGVPAKDEWISNVLNYYRFEKEPKEENDDKEIDVDYVRILISRAKKKIPDYKTIFQQHEESG